MKAQKTLLLLGGARYALPVIDAAHELGARVVTCDYLPGNYAHRFSDGYVDASIVDRGAVLSAAREVRADGIMSFAADPGVVSAAYAAEELGLPFQGPLASIEVLQDKERFRAFLADNGFNCPERRVFPSAAAAAAAADSLEYPVIAKPVDSAGSKGCSRVDSPGGLAAAVGEALKHSLSGRCIVERFLERRGDSSDADAFLVGGEFRCVSFTSQLFDPACPNPYTPAAYAMPASMPAWAQGELRSELQRLAGLLGLRDGVFNVETRVAADGRAYVMELAPRGGGNRLSEMLRLATGGEVDLVRGAVQAALGMPVDRVSEPVCDGVWYQEMLHSGRAGEFRGVSYAPGFREAHVAEEQLWVALGERVGAFDGANRAFGSVFLRFDDRVGLDAFLADREACMRVEVG